MAGTLAKALAAAPPPPPADSGARVGTVTAVNPTGTGVRLTVAGASVPSDTSQWLSCLGSYPPRVGDVVVALRQGASWVVLGALAISTPWQTLTPTGSWANFGGSFAPLSYRRVSNRVEVYGLLSGGISTGGTVIATLPAGFAPAHTVRKPIYAFGPSLNIGNESPGVDVSSSGTIALLGVGNATILGFDFDVPLDL